MFSHERGIPVALAGTAYVSMSATCSRGKLAHLRDETLVEIIFCGLRILEPVQLDPVWIAVWGDDLAHGRNLENGHVLMTQNWVRPRARTCTLSFARGNKPLQQDYPYTRVLGEGADFCIRDAPVHVPAATGVPRS